MLHPATLRFTCFTGILAAFVVLNSGCMLLNLNSIVGSGTAATEDRVTDSFDSIQLSGAATSTISCGTENSVKVTVDDNIMEHIQTKVSNGKLSVYSDESYSTKVGLNVDIGVDELKSLSLSGASKSTIVDCNTDDLKISVSGASKVTATGKVRTLTLDVSGASKLYLADLEAETVVVNVSGASKIEVNASTKLEVDASGASTVSYLGDAEVSQDISGAAKVRKIDGN